MPFQRERPVSPLDGWWVKDDFITNSGVATVTTGELDWIHTAIGTVDIPTFLTGDSGGNGVMRLTGAGAGADGDGIAMHVNADSNNFDAGTGGGFSFKFRYPTITGNQLAGNDFRIGIEDSVTATAPAVGLSVFSDAGVLSLRSDSTNGDQSVAVSGVSTLTSGTTAIIDTWHTVEVVWSGENGNGGPSVVNMKVDGENAAALVSVIGSAEDGECKIVHYQNTGGAATLELDIDFVEFFMWRDVL